ncbi:trimeric intracellular cation channel family protein [Streptococcus loxodontisalivarius]|uniref:Membrane protein YeiH n=1 Tax=Streptococcus loxodontisalivarius TaxID=1349415 RepID=A0ABS2PQD7_9STRE|nr:trimeric intracellular cation channel family protein [Streptococcus loxodontisalivarius]MBM7642254.1 putative membrane protein YeiH [Streptococcus loxodontisalivarius]
MESTIWEILSIIGTIAFAVSGALVAIEEDFDVLGIFTLGFLTAFGGGTIRNLLIGLPMTALWSQQLEFYTALVAILLLIIFPQLVFRHWKKAELWTDALGLAAFSIQGALHAQNLHQPLSAVIVAAVLTGAGGGVVRDVLAGRKPIILRSEIYAGWAILAALLIYFHIVTSDLGYFGLVIALTVLRMYGYWKNWHLPKVTWVEREDKDD